VQYSKCRVNAVALGMQSLKSCLSSRGAGSSAWGLRWYHVTSWAVDSISLGKYVCDRANASVSRSETNLSDAGKKGGSLRPSNGVARN
jgi:hypothetical protein